MSAGAVPAKQVGARVLLKREGPLLAALGASVVVAVVVSQLIALALLATTRRQLA